MRNKSPVIDIMPLVKHPTSLQKQLAVLAMLAAIAVFGLAAFPSGTINSFGYTGGRSAQSYAAYHCFVTQDFVNAAKCFFLPPTGADTNNYFPLDAPVVSLLQAILFPFNSPDSLANGVQLTFLLVLLLVLAGARFARSGSAIDVFIGFIVAWSFVRSPTVVFFANSFQQNLSSASLILCGSFIATQSSFRRTGLILSGVGCAMYPQFALVAGSVVVWLISFAPQEEKGSLAKVCRSAIVDCAILYGPLLLYLTLGYLGTGLGFAVRYPHDMGHLKLEQVYDGTLWRTAADNFGLGGVSLIIVLSAVSAVTVVRAVQEGNWKVVISVFVPLFAFFVTYVLIFDLIHTNTYYGSLTILAAAMSYLYCASYSIFPRMNLAAKCFLASLISFACLPTTLITLSSRGWSSQWIYVQLTNNPISCQPGDAKKLVEGVSAGRPLYLNAGNVADPYIRTALLRSAADVYRGTNIDSTAIDADLIARLKQEKAYLLGCDAVSGVMTDEQRRELQQNATGTSQGDWYLLSF